MSHASGAKSSSGANQSSRRLKPVMPDVEALLGRGKLGRFKLESLLGLGAMGAVLRAEDKLLHRQVALKLLPVAKGNDQQKMFLDQFLREARSAARLVHPHVLQIFKVGIAEGHAYIEMELVDGPNFRELVHRDGPLDYPHACELIAQAAEALDYAHQQGVLHRDVKPANILLRQHGGAKLCDFGFARTGWTSGGEANRLENQLDRGGPKTRDGSGLSGDEDSNAEPGDSQMLEHLARGGSSSHDEPGSASGSHGEAEPADPGERGDARDTREGARHRHRSSRDGQAAAEAHGRAPTGSETRHGGGSEHSSALPFNVMGTPRYLSPEAARGETSPASDLWGLAAVLWFMLSGESPFDVHTIVEARRVYIEIPRRDLRDYRTDLPLGLVEFFDKAMALNVEERFDSGRAFAAALKPFALAGHQLPVANQVSRASRAHRPAKPSRAESPRQPSADHAGRGDRAALPDARDRSSNQNEDDTAPDEGFSDGLEADLAAAARSAQGRSKGRSRSSAGANRDSHRHHAQSNDRPRGRTQARSEPKTKGSAKRGSKPNSKAKSKAKSKSPANPKATSNRKASSLPWIVGMTVAVVVLAVAVIVAVFGG